MQLELLCPVCGVHKVDFEDYSSTILLAPNLALMQFKCTSCDISLSVTVKLTAEMLHRINMRIQHQGVGEQSAVIDKISYASHLIVDSEYDSGSLLHPLKASNLKAKSHIEYFKQQLESVETVDEVIDEIDTNIHREKRDR